MGARGVPTYDFAMTLRLTAILLLAAAWPAVAEPAPIQVPTGYSVELAAGAPLIERPMFACFDEQGRLYVADAAGLNLKRADLEKQKPNRIIRLEDVDGDGRFEKRTVFADGMTLPMGAAWLSGALYVASPPSLWRLRDTDDDGIADERTELVTGFGYSGNAASIHGPVVGPSGRLWWTDGHGHRVVDSGGKLISEGKAAGIFAMQPDGTRFERYAAGGMDNPVGLCFLPTGEAIGTVNLMEADPRQDTLVHWQRGGVYPRKDFAEQFGKEMKPTGDLLQPIHSFGHVAVSDLDLLRVGQKNDDRYELLVALFNTHEMVRVTLEREGSTFRATAAPFLKRDDPFFHPTDVLEDADGSVLVLDTGGWFRIGCPVSGEARPQHTGGIYRIRRDDLPRMTDPRGLKLDWQAAAETLIARLDDDRPAVRDRAVATLAARGIAAVPTLQAALKTASVRGKTHAVWTLSRIEGVEADRALREAIVNTDAAVRQAAATAAGLRRDVDAVAALNDVVDNDIAPVQRAAAEAIGRLQSPTSVPDLIATLRAGTDRPLNHAVTYALIEAAPVDALTPLLQDEHAGVRSAALLALDAKSDGLTPTLVLNLLQSENNDLRRAALDVFQRRGWSEGLDTALSHTLDAGDESLAIGIVTAFGGKPAVQRSLAERLPAAPPTLQAALLEALPRAGVEQLEPQLAQALRTQLTNADRTVALQTILTVEAIAKGALQDDLLTLAHDADRSRTLRLAAWRAAAPHAKQINNTAFALLIESLVDADAPAMDRLNAARALGSIPLNAAQCQTLASHMHRVGPIELAAVITAFDHPGDAATGQALFRHLNDNPASASLGVRRVTQLAKHYPQESQTEADTLIERLSAAERERRSALAAYANVLGSGDVARGRRLFFAPEATCVACHRVAGKGGTVGPDLSTIGKSRSAEDLLEAIVLPSSTFARGYEPFVITLTNGQPHYGSIIREAADAIVVRSQAGEVRLPRANIRAIEPGTMSMMPLGLDRVLGPEKLADLVAFLRSLK